MQTRGLDPTCTIFAHKVYIWCVSLARTPKMIRNSLKKVILCDQRELKRDRKLSMYQRNVHVCPINIVGWFSKASLSLSLSLSLWINARKAKFTWIAWNFNGLNGIQSTSWLPKAPHRNRPRAKNFVFECVSFFYSSIYFSFVWIS